MRYYNFKTWFTGILVLLLVILALSCKKEPECYECTTTFKVTVKYLDLSETYTTSDTQSFCDMTEAEKDLYETSNTGTTVEQSADITTTTVKTTKCKL